MKFKVAFAFIVGLLAHSTAHAQTADRIRELDAGWARSYATHDTAYAMQLMAEDFFMTSTDGRTKNRQAELGDIRANPDLKMEYFRTLDVNVRLLEGGASVTGKAEWKFTYKGRVSEVARRYTAVYARGGPLGYQLVTLHIGRAPE